MATCPACGAQNLDSAKYCDDCGAELPAPAASQPSESAPPEAAPAAAASGAHLVVASTGVTIPLSKPETVIGREDPVSNIFPDIDTTPFGGLEGGISRKHAKITEQGGQYLIEDLNSTNYTFVNKQRLDPGQPQPLSPGDEIRLGRLVFTFMV
ncbi:MAG: FHA domain-containing protein [Candidatus Latescibacteria bacterium]|nr:FHA domain-containing protein [Candidatus Latescibacterota bacterium]